MICKNRIYHLCYYNHMNKIMSGTPGLKCISSQPMQPQRPNMTKCDKVFHLEKNKVLHLISMLYFLPLKANQLQLSTTDFYWQNAGSCNEISQNTFDCVTICLGIPDQLLAENDVAKTKLEIKQKIKSYSQMKKDLQPGGQILPT